MSAEAEAAVVIAFIKTQAIRTGKKQLARGNDLDDVLTAGMLCGFMLGLECAKNAPEWAMMIFEGIRTNIDDLPLSDEESRDRIDRLVLMAKTKVHVDEYVAEGHEDWHDRVNDA